MPTSRNALVVDDSPSSSLLLTSLLQDLGLSVVSAGDGETALALAREHRPELVCLDLMLPTLSGLEVCDQLRREPATAQVPIIMVSARRFPQDRAAACQLGADAYLTKPLDRGEFQACARSLLWQRRTSGAAS